MVRKLAQFPELGSLVLRMDPLLPVIDDNDDNIERVLKDASAAGVREAVFGYVIVTETLREEMAKVPELKAPMAALSERTPTISKRPLYSYPFVRKVEKFEHFNLLCSRYGVTMAVCGCKDERLKRLPLQWVCHPFKRRKERHVHAHG